MGGGHSRRYGRLVGLILMINGPCLGHAWTVSSLTEKGEDSSSQKVGVSHLLEGNPRRFALDTVRASYRYSVSELSSSTLHGTDVNGGLAARFLQNGDVSFDLGRTRTQEISYEQQNYEMGLGWKFVRGEQSLQIRGLFGESRTRQDVDVTILNREYRRTVDLEARTTGVEVFADVVRWLSLSAFSTSYRYNKEAGQLQTALQSRFLNLRASNLLDTLAALPKRTYGAGVTFIPSESWEIPLRYSRTVVYADESDSEQYSLEITKLWEAGWSTGLEVSYLKSSFIAVKPAYALNVAYTF